MKRWLSLARNERGNVLAIVIAMLTVLLLISGVAMDMGRVIAVRAELQRALDASALAGAGNLDPSQGSTIPSGVRSNAVSYAAANQYSGGNVTLNANTGNADPTNGHVITGIFDGATWQASNDGTQVNAVNCQWTAPVATSFLGLLGFETISVKATARGFVGPVAKLDAPILPLALPSVCDFTSLNSGCGAGQMFLNVGWVRLDGSSGAGTSYFTNPGGTGAIDQAFNGQIITLAVGSQINGVPTSGTKTPIINAMTSDFQSKFASSPVYTVQTPGGTTTYIGHAWKVAFPVVDTGSCPPGDLGGGQTFTIKSFAYLFVTQFIDDNGVCAVTNNYAGSLWGQYCPGGANAGTLTSQRGTVFGYYNCTRVPVLSMAPSPGNNGTGIWGAPILVK